MTTKLRWTVLNDADAVARAACDRIVEAAENVIAGRDTFSLVLAGGRTPERAYRLLAETDQQWSRWQLYFGDERCLPADHPQRNSAMAARALTDRMPISPQQVHPIPAELGAEEAAQIYAREIEPALPFDLVLLGLGEDGHTASLFPGRIHPEKEIVVPVHSAPKPPPDRVSLNTGTLGQCRRLLFLVTGESKRDAVRRWQSGEDIPAARIAPEGIADVLLDQAAAGKE
ncbi:MAG: 6-phosphogluconolactonase [Pseudomonadota bacterium]|nr:6-phosphogluconolactonase [Pseudomonadota bacterium]